MKDDKLGHKKSFILYNPKDEPADISKEGVKTWYKGGVRHREGGKPAIIHPLGKKEWFLNGKRHRTNGPAVTDARTSEQSFLLEGNLGSCKRTTTIKQWYREGLLHRTDGPAKSYTTSGKAKGAVAVKSLGVESLKEWYQKGVRHRLDGPAVIRKAKVNKEDWYIRGVWGKAKVNKEDWYIRGVWVKGKLLGLIEYLTQHPENLPLYINHPVLKELIAYRLKEYK